MFEEEIRRSYPQMKLICSKANLLNGVQIVSKAVPNKTTMSILECILIDASKGDIRLTANDMELGIETVVSGEIIEKGIIALDAKIFQEIIRHLPDNDITIETDESNRTTITCEKAIFNIIGKSGEDFSYLPTIEKSLSLMLSQFSLKQVIGQTLFSVADNDNNKIMMGELFHLKDDVLRIVALDGHRVSIRKLHLKDHFDEQKYVIPGKTLSEIAKILPGDTDKDVSIFFTDKHVLFEFDQTTVVSRLLEGEYFNIDQMITEDYETKIDVSKKDFYNCIERATLLTKEGDKKPVIIHFTNDYMELRINSAIGSMDETIDITKEGKDVMIGFNAKFLLDALRVIDEETISIYLVNPKAPCFIRDQESNYIYMVLPVNFTTVQ